MLERAVALPCYRGTFFAGDALDASNQAGKSQYWFLIGCSLSAHCASAPPDMPVVTQNPMPAATQDAIRIRHPRLARATNSFDVIYWQISSRESANSVSVALRRFA